MHGETNGKGILLAILAAAFYALSTPFSKLLLDYMPETLTAGFLYLGAGLAMGAVFLFRRCTGNTGQERRLTRRELPFTLAMIVLDIAAPICMLIGLKTTAASAASLLGNFEIAATAILALAVFREAISPRLWAGIVFVMLSCTVLSLGGADGGGLRFSPGSLFILLAAVFWGFENNCTRMLSSKDPLQIVLLKGIFSGLGSVVIGLAAGERLTVWWSVPAVLAVGAAAYGMSIYLYIYAQRLLGAARTSAYYAAAPFIGTFLSLLLLRELPGPGYGIGLVLMAAGAFLAASDRPLFRKKDKTNSEESNDRS